MIEFKSEREFPELSNKPIKDSRFLISKAIETVQFKMDEAGVKLKPAFAGTGYDERVRFFPDFGARLYFMEKM